VSRLGVRVHALAWCATLVVLAACSTTPDLRKQKADEESRASDARIISSVAARVAVSKVGAKVCRKVSIGISESDWIRGEVKEVGGNKIRVQIENPGRFPETLGGVPVAKGALIWDTALLWAPCI
jgi:hypothetical protein